MVTLLADCYLRLGQNKEVIDLLTSVQRADPSNQAFNYLLGTALVRDGQAAKGQFVIDRILKNGDSAEARLLMGTTKYIVSDFRGALEDLQKAVELNPNLAEANAYYGLALLASGDQANARKAFERELKADPNNFESNLRMGVILRQDEENDEALKYLQKALQIRRGDPGVLYQIASVELAGGQVDRAQHDLEALVRAEPKFLEAHVSLATVYFRQKKKPLGRTGARYRCQAECRTPGEQRGWRERPMRVRPYFLLACLPGIHLTTVMHAEWRILQCLTPARYASAQPAIRRRRSRIPSHRWPMPWSFPPNATFSSPTQF